jgi:hypothetical protein
LRLKRGGNFYLIRLPTRNATHLLDIDVISNLSQDLVQHYRTPKHLRVLIDVNDRSSKCGVFTENAVFGKPNVCEGGVALGSLGYTLSQAVSTKTSRTLPHDSRVQASMR